MEVSFLEVYLLNTLLLRLFLDLVLVFALSESHSLSKLTGAAITLVVVLFNYLNLLRCDPSEVAQINRLLLRSAGISDPHLKVLL